MTMQIAPARPSLAMYGKSLAETTAIKDWMMRRIGQTSIPWSSMTRRHPPNINGLGAGWPGERAGTVPWRVTQFGSTQVKPWRQNDGGRRTWRGKIPESSMTTLMGIGSLAEHVNPKAQWHPWPINTLAETTRIKNTEPRRVGKERFWHDGEWHEQASISGFAGFGALDAQVQVTDLQTAMRKIGICTGSGGQRMAIDGSWGPITESAFAALLAQLGVPGTTAQNIHATLHAATANMETSLWTRISTLATGRIDNCAGSAPSRTGGGAPDPGPGPGPGPSPDAGGGDTGMPEEAGSWYSNPLLWLGVAAVAGIAYYTYSSGGETPDYGGGDTGPDPIAVFY